MPEVRVNARLSINKLGEYLEASAGRRERILRDQKFPKEVVVLYYKEAADAICEYIRSGFDVASLDKQYQELGEKPTTTVRQVKRLNDCLQAFEKFHNLSETELISKLDGFRILSAPMAPKEGTISIEGVEVSLRPEFYIRGTDKRGNEIKGLLKLYISRNQPLTKYTAEAIAAVSMEHLGCLSDPPGRPDASIVLVADVFAQAIYVAPKSTKRLMQDVTAACREIARSWEQIESVD